MPTISKKELDDYVAACSGLNAMVEQTPVPSRKPDTGQTCGK